MNKATELSYDRLAHDRGPPMVFTAGASNKPRWYVYVDNLGIIATQEEAVVDAYDTVESEFNRQQLKLHSEGCTRVRLRPWAWCLTAAASRRVSPPSGTGR